MRFDTGCPRRTMRRDGSRKYQSAYVSLLITHTPWMSKLLQVRSASGASGSQPEIKDKGVEGNGFLDVAAQEADQFVHLAGRGVNPIETDP